MTSGPLNDLAEIKLDADEYGFAGASEKDTAESGILVSLPSSFTYFGFWSFAFEDSFMSRRKLKKLRKHWQKFIGKRVYWTAMSERGNIIKVGNERLAYIKLTSLIRFDEPDLIGENLHSGGSGGFKV